MPVLVVPWWSTLATPQGILTLALLVVVGIIGLVVAFRWQREAAEDDSPATARELLDPLERAYYSGYMNEDELVRIRQALGQADSPAPKRSKRLAVPTNPPPVEPPDDAIGSA